MQISSSLTIPRSIHGFRSTLDGDMKRLNGTGNYLNKKQVQPITQEQENRLWELGLLGDHNAQVLLNTIVYCKPNNVNEFNEAPQFVKVKDR